MASQEMGRCEASAACALQFRYGKRTVAARHD